MISNKNNNQQRKYVPLYTLKKIGVMIIFFIFLVCSFLLLLLLLCYYYYYYLPAKEISEIQEGEVGERKKQMTIATRSVQSQNCTAIRVPIDNERRLCQKMRCGLFNLTYYYFFVFTPLCVVCVCVCVCVS